MNNDQFDEKEYYKTSKRKKNKKNKKKKKSQILFKYGYPKYLTAILYDYQYTKIDDFKEGQCIKNDINNGIWWSRQRQREYFPVINYLKMDSIENWMKDNGYLKRPIYDGESELHVIPKYIRFVRQLYRQIYHQKYDVVIIIWALTSTLLVLRIVHEYVQIYAGDPLIERKN